MYIYTHIIYMHLITLLFGLSGAGRPWEPAGFTQQPPEANTL